MTFVMERAVFTTLCMVYDQEGRVLVQERRGTRWDGLAFPGGHVEPGESFVQAAAREVQEETGYQVRDLRLCGVKQFPLEGGGRYLIFLYKTGTFSGRLASSGEGRVFWLEREALPTAPLARDMLDMMELFDREEKSEFYYLPGQEGVYITL